MGLAALASEFMLESEQEIIFLLRHYTDNLAPWYAPHPGATTSNLLMNNRLDIFGEKCFFQTCVPRLVGTNLVLKYAIAAVAAKHLSHVGGFRATDCGLKSTLALTEFYPGSGQVDWAFKAANYYHQAVTNAQQHSLLYNAGESALHGGKSSNFTDILIASNAILTVYEMIDSNYGEFTT